VTTGTQKTLFRVVFLASALSVCREVTAQGDLDFAVSPSPVGSGARAAGMANAFVAIADDATAAAWNPAGLVQLELPEISVVGSFNSIFEELSASAHPEVDRWLNSQEANLNFLSVTYPLPTRLLFGRNASVGLYFQRKYEFERKLALDFDNARTRSDGKVVASYGHIRFTQNGGLHSISPAFAFEITNRLSIGVAVNFWHDSFLGENGWENTTTRRDFTQIGAELDLTRISIKERYENFRGENLSIGVLWSPTDRWSFGGRWDSSFTADVDFERRLVDSRGLLGMPNLTLARSEERRRVRLPDTYAFGLAYRANDRFTVSADVSMTDWNDFWVEAENGIRTSLVNDAPIEEVDFDDTYTIRLGAEYVRIPKNPTPSLDRLWTLRGGLFFDQEPATGRPDNYYGLALGVGLLLDQRVNLDFAYQLRWGPGVNQDSFRGAPIDEDVFQSRFLVSTTVYFN
jgi:long-subunit fatty acid transport protein